VVEILLNNGALVNIADKNGRTPLMVIARLGNESIFDLILERGYQNDASDLNGNLITLLYLLTCF